MASASDLDAASAAGAGADAGAAGSKAVAAPPAVVGRARGGGGLAGHLDGDGCCDGGAGSGSGRCSVDVAAAEAAEAAQRATLATLSSAASVDDGAVLPYDLTPQVRGEGWSGRVGGEQEGRKKGWWGRCAYAVGAPQPSGDAGLPFAVSSEQRPQRPGRAYAPRRRHTS